MSVELELKLEAVRQGVPIKTLAERMEISSDRLYKSFSDPARSLRTIEIIKGARALNVSASDLFARAEVSVGA